MKDRSVGPALVALALAVLIHVDWHLARSSHHGGLSAGWSWHWILAVPAFAVVGWCAHRTWGPNALRAGLAVTGLAALLSQGLEPLGELATGASWAWTFGPERLGAFLLYIGAGVVTLVVAVWALRRLAPNNTS